MSSQAGRPAALAAALGWLLAGGCGCPSKPPSSKSSPAPASSAGSTAPAPAEVRRSFTVYRDGRSGGAPLKPEEREACMGRRRLSIIEPSARLLAFYDRLKGSPQAAPFDDDKKALLLGCQFVQDSSPEKDGEVPVIFAHEGTHMLGGPVDGGRAHLYARLDAEGEVRLSRRAGLPPASAIGPLFAGKPHFRLASFYLSGDLNNDLYDLLEEWHAYLAGIEAQFDALAGKGCPGPELRERGGRTVILERRRDDGHGALEFQVFTLVYLRELERLDARAHAALKSDAALLGLLRRLAAGTSRVTARSREFPCLFFAEPLDALQRDAGDLGGVLVEWTGV